MEGEVVLDQAHRHIDQGGEHRAHEEEDHGGELPPPRPAGHPHHQRRSQKAAQKHPELPGVALGGAHVAENGHIFGLGVDHVDGLLAHTEEHVQGGRQHPARLDPQQRGGGHGIAEDPLVHRPAGGQGGPHQGHDEVGVEDVVHGVYRAAPGEKAPQVGQPPPRQGEVLGQGEALAEIQPEDHGGGDQQNQEDGQGDEQLPAPVDMEAALLIGAEGVLRRLVQMDDDVIGQAGPPLSGIRIGHGAIGAPPECRRAPPPSDHGGRTPGRRCGPRPPPRRR